MEALKTEIRVQIWNTAYLTYSDGRSGMCQCAPSQVRQAVKIFAAFCAAVFFPSMFQYVPSQVRQAVKRFVTFCAAVRFPPQYMSMCAFSGQSSCKKIWYIICSCVVFPSMCQCVLSLHSVQPWGFSSECINMCLLRWHNCPKDLSHSVQLCGFSPLCVNMCLLRLNNLWKDLSHFVQLYGFSPVCINMWFLRLDNCPKDLSHSVHICDFSPLCVTMCLLRLDKFWKDLSHSVQLCAFSPLCVTMCLLRLDKFWKDLSHSVQLYFTPLCINMCFLRWHKYLKDLSHSVQLCGFPTLWTTICLPKLLLCARESIMCLLRSDVVSKYLSHLILLFSFAWYSCSLSQHCATDTGIFFSAELWTVSLYSTSHITPTYRPESLEGPLFSVSSTGSCLIYVSVCSALTGNNCEEGILSYDSLLLVYPHSSPAVISFFVSHSVRSVISEHCCSLKIDVFLSNLDTDWPPKPLTPVSLYSTSHFIPTYTPESLEVPLFSVSSTGSCLIYVSVCSAVTGNNCEEGILLYVSLLPEYPHSSPAVIPFFVSHFVESVITEHSCSLKVDVFLSKLDTDWTPIPLTPESSLSFVSLLGTRYEEFTHFHLNGIFVTFKHFQFLMILLFCII